MSTKQIILQWGRNFFVTEISQLQVLCPATSKVTFNGAVTFSLRKSRITNDNIELQKTFNGAVTFSLRKFHRGSKRGSLWN